MITKTNRWRLKQALKADKGAQVAACYLAVVALLALFLPWLPLPFLPGNLDLALPFVAPFSAEALASGHWLGTDQLGRDVLVNLLYGFRTGFQIAVPVMVVALLLGTGLGSVAGFWGNKRFKVTRASLLSWSLWLPAVIFYCFYVVPQTAGQQTGWWVLGYGLLWFSGLSAAAFGIGKGLKTLGFLRSKVAFPVDELVVKTMEVLTSVPRLVLVLSFSALLAPGLGNIFLLLSLTYWAGPARLVRAEVLKIKQLSYVEAARVSGLPEYRILWSQVLPNAAAPLWVVFGFGLSGLLGLEATLSFLGIGLPPEVPSWGRMLASARLNPEAWWLVAFPALLLCFTMLAIQTLSNFLRKTLR